MNTILGTDLYNIISKDGDNAKEKICKPINTIIELQDFFNDPPEWIKFARNFASSSSNTIKYNGNGRCHYHPTRPIYEKRYNRNDVPKTLVCHDFKNGYLQDRFINGCKNECDGYVFDKWYHIDVFVYFSHNLITIPPLGWINLAHKHGVKILGTFITEWDNGEAFWNNIIDNNLLLSEIDKNIINLAEDLVRLMSMIKLDGWLINIENPVTKPQYLLSFVKHLTHSAHKINPGSLIIWYDSVTELGHVKWQNELNSKNRCYFDACDGIFLNYNWTPEGLRRSAMTAEHRHLDVYAGIDVFGRGCYGNGRFHSYVAVRETRKANVSMAIFAPGWTHETLPPVDDSNRQEITTERFLHRDNAFWRSLGPFLYTHPIDQPFFTTFNIGANAQIFDLRKQDIMLHRIPHSKQPANEEELNVETLLQWRCDCVRLYHDHGSGTGVVELVGGNKRAHRLLTCDISLAARGGPLTLVTVTERPLGENNTLLQILLTVEDDCNGCRRRIICIEKEDLVTGEGKSISLIHDRSVIEISSDKRYYMEEIIKAYPNLLPQYRFNTCTLDLEYGNIIDISVEVINGTKLLLRAIGIIDSDMFNTTLWSKSH